MNTSLRRRYQSDLLTLDAQKRTGEITRAQYDDARIRLAKEMVWRGLVLPARASNSDQEGLIMNTPTIAVAKSHVRQVRDLLRSGAASDQVILNLIEKYKNTPAAERNWFYTLNTRAVLREAKRRGI